MQKLHISQIRRRMAYDPTIDSQINEVKFTVHMPRSNTTSAGNFLGQTLEWWNSQDLSQYPQDQSQDMEKGTFLIFIRALYRVMNGDIHYIVDQLLSLILHIIEASKVNSNLKLGGTFQTTPYIYYQTQPSFPFLCQPPHFQK